MNIKRIDSYKQLGLNINYYRRSKGYTQMELAGMAGIDITHISKIELSKVGVSLDVLFDISNALEIPVYKLFVFRE